MGSGNFFHHTFGDDRVSIPAAIFADYISIFLLFTSGNFTHDHLFKVYISSLSSG